MTPIQVFKGTWSLCCCIIALGFAIGFAFCVINLDFLTAEGAEDAEKERGIQKVRSLPFV